MAIESARGGIQEPGARHSVLHPHAPSGPQFLSLRRAGTVSLPLAGSWEEGARGFPAGGVPSRVLSALAWAAWPRSSSPRSKALKPGGLGTLVGAFPLTTGARAAAGGLHTRPVLLGPGPGSCLGRGREGWVEMEAALGARIRPGHGNPSLSGIPALPCLEL